MADAERDAGAVAILVAIFAVVVFGFASIVVDLGYARGLKETRNNAADAAALAAAQKLPQTPPPSAADYNAATLAARDAVAANVSGDANLDSAECPAPPDASWQQKDSGTDCITYLAGTATSPTFVRIALPTVKSPTFIAGAIGKSAPTIRAVSYAEVSASGVHLAAAP